MSDPQWPGTVTLEAVFRNESTERAFLGILAYESKDAILASYISFIFSYS